LLSFLIRSLHDQRMVQECRRLGAAEEAPIRICRPVEGSRSVPQNHEVNLLPPVVHRDRNW
jgi:hypothetical protein